jgi:dTDP-4-dehydrorhamnose 3,5-epimerase
MCTPTIEKLGATPANIQWTVVRGDSSTLAVQFLQDNESCSHKGVLRGLHFQNPPHAQGKLVRVVKGRVLDVAVDIRKNSSTYGQYISVELSALNHEMLWIPEGFAHGFLSLDDDTIFQYKCTNNYNKESEGGLLWDDESLNINWGIENPIVSEKDMELISFTSLISKF